MIIWDRGSYRPLGDRPVEQALEAGHLSFWLEGEKLRGGWTLQRVEGEALDPRQAARRRGRRTPQPGSTQPESVVSGRRIDEVES